jgi:hypothetical protein
MKDKDKKTSKIKKEAPEEIQNTIKEENTDVITVKTAPYEEKESDKFNKEENKLSEDLDIKTEKKPVIDEESDVKKVTSFGLIDSDKPKSDLGLEENKDTSIISETKDTMEESTPSEEKKEVSKDEVNKWIENYDEVNKPTEKGDKKGFKIILIILLLLSFFAILVGGFLYYQKNISKKEVTTEAKPTPTVEVQVSPTETPATDSGKISNVKLSNLNVQILNGSGIPGQAGGVKTLISTLNFKKIDTGNADNYNYTDTEVSLKDSIPTSVFDQIKTKLVNTYNVVQSKNAVSKTSSYDIIIIVGTKK